MEDRNIWKSIGGKNFCAFKMTSRTETFCKNKNNVSGLCNEASCPLANFHYATIREENETLYLYIKVPERVHTPAQTYEKIELSRDYNAALSEIEKNLEYWDHEVVKKCKQRLTKLTLYLRRRKNLSGKVEMRTIKKKQTRREKAGAIKALGKVSFEKNIEKELYKRLECGIYGTEIKDRFEKRHKVYEFEESDEDYDSPSNKKKSKTKGKATW